MHTGMDRTFLSLIAALLMAVIAPPANAQASPITIELSQPNRPMTLEVGILSAKIIVIGERRNNVELEVDGRENGRKIITPSGPKAVPNGSYRVSASEDNNEVEISSEWNRSQLELVIRVPQTANLNLWTTNDGTIEVRGVTGEMQLENTNGPITVAGAASAVIAESINEDIEIGFSDLKGVAASSLATVNGDLAIVLPARPAVELHIDTARGEITSDFEIEVVPSEPRVSRSQENGTIEIGVENLIIAKIGGGGPVIRMKTLNGDIEINQAE